MKTYLMAAAAVCALVAAPSQAASITGFGTPTSNAALAGGSVVDFETAALGSAANRTFGNLSITGATVVEDAYAGQFNTFGNRYLQNSSGATSVITFTFANAVSAFGFNLGAADQGDWTLSAGGQTYSYHPTGDGNSKNYYGISGTNITSATLTFLPGDYVLIDNVTSVASSTAAVPEPATWAMMTLGFGAMGFAMRRKKVNTRIRFA